MYQLQRFFSITIVLGFMLGSIGSSIHHPVFANQRQNKRQSVSALLSRIFQPMKEKGGTRGGICLVALRLGETGGVWNDRPLFLWDREISRIEVHPENTDTPVWSQTVPANSRSIIYQGQPLQPGQTYAVILFDRNNSPFIKDPAFHPKFTLLTESERQTIAANLAAIENQLKSQGDTDEEIASKKAEYFAEKKLWSDALQSIHSIQDPSLELQTFIQKLVTEVCQPEISSSFPRSQILSGNAVTSGSATFGR